MGWSWNFNIDWYLNRVVPPPPWRYVPYPIAHFLGHRRTKVRDIGNLRPIFWAFIGIFCALSIIEVVSERIPAFQDRGAPLIIGSFGAAAVLEFYAIESPLAQPRNAIGGQILSSLVGVGVCKLFRLSSNFDGIRWAGGALSCAAATALMGITKTVHPPAGATALLAVVNDDVMDLGWFLLPVMMLGLGLMLAVALLINNIERQFPIYWWTAEDLSRPRPEEMLQRKKTVVSDDEDRRTEKTESTLDLEASGVGGSGEGDDVGSSRRGSARTEVQVPEIIIRPGQVIVPEHLFLRQEEMQWLEGLSQRL